MPIIFNNKSTNLSDKTNHYIDNYWLLIIALLISPIIEEKLFREYLWKKVLMKHIKNIYISALLSSMLFSLAHLSLNFLPFVGNGLVFVGFTTKLTQSLTIYFFILSIIHL